MTRIPTLISIMCLMGPALAWAAEDTRRDRIMHLLQGYEWHIDAPAFDRLGDDAFEALIDIAEDPDVAGVFRERAFAALGLYPNRIVRDYLFAQLEAPETTVRRRRTVEVLCAAFGDSRLGEIEESLLPYLEARDAHLRTKVAKCLEGSTDPRVDRALARYRARIVESWEARAAGFESGQPR